ncbi:MAG: class C beta-lactamase-related serine hydrolase [Candidatus Electrothrix sp. GM3_4]|nr:class C beta-lactamase-related serine hydrolase [Candidatus Electrothrix sp. GM3_4]
MIRSLCLLFFCCLCLLSFCSPCSEDIENIKDITEKRDVTDHRIKRVVFPKKEWEEQPSETLCSNAKALGQFTKAVGGSGVIIKNGYLIKTWGNPAGRTMWASATKPVLSTLLLFAAQEGRVKIDGKVRAFMPELLGKDQEITFHHLANMTSGYARRESPGQAFAYNDYAVKLYHNTLFRRVFSATDPNPILLHRTRLGPLQFQDGDVFEQVGKYGWFVHTSPRDFARIGWFWLNKGNWNGEQLLNKSFFEHYLRNQVSESLPISAKPARDYLGIGTYGGSGNQSQFGPGNYGMNWWFNSGKRIWPSLPEDTFQANGHWNKETVTVIPSMALVVAGVGNFGPFQPGSGSADSLMALIAEACGQEPIR